jgi:hypothetical protein
LTFRSGAVQAPIFTVPSTVPTLRRPAGVLAVSVVVLVLADLGWTVFHGGSSSKHATAAAAAATIAAVVSAVA